MHSETRVWISAVLGGPLVMAVAAQAQDAEVSTSSIVGIVAGVVGVVLVGSVLALCGSSEKAPSIRIHDPTPAPERPVQPTQPPPSSLRPQAQVRPKPMHEMSEQSVQIDFSRAQHQQGKPQYMPPSHHQYPPSNGRPSAGHDYSSQGSNASAPGMQSQPGYGNQGYQQRPPPQGPPGQPGYQQQYQQPSQYQQPQYQPPPQQPGHYGYGHASGRPSYGSGPPMHPQGSGSMRQSYPGPSPPSGGPGSRPMQSGSFGSVDPNERVSMPYVDSYDQHGRPMQTPSYPSGRSDAYRVSDGSPSPAQKRPPNPTAEGRPLVRPPSDKPWTPMQTPPGAQQAPPGQARVSSPQMPPGAAGIPNPTPPPRSSPGNYVKAPHPPAMQSPPAPAGPMLAPRDGSLDALADFLRELIERTGGRCGNGPYTIDGEQPIRKCLYSVQCTCKTTFGKSVDALFFASKTDYDRQHNICSKRPLQEFRADVREVVEASTFRDANSGLNVAVPNFIITEATSSMDDLIANMPTVQRNSTISAIATQLTTQLVMLHSKKIVHCGVTRRNIVQLGGMNAIWTFREYCSYVGEGKDMEAARHLQEVRILPPEAAEAAMRQAPMVATAAMDIWQLGVLLYELYAGSTYWPAEASPEEILRDLSTPGGLPHEKDPAKLNAIARSSPALQAHKGIITRMLDRNPAARPNAATLKRDLIASASDITMQGNTVTSWQAPVVNIGSSAPRV